MICYTVKDPGSPLNSEKGLKLALIQLHWTKNFLKGLFQPPEPLRLSTHKTASVLYNLELGNLEYVNLDRIQV